MIEKAGYILDVNHAHDLFKQGPSGFVCPSIVLKRWGYEEIIINQDYCCKKLVLSPMQNTSLHFHEKKVETMIAVKGQVEIEYTYLDSKLLMCERREALPLFRPFHISPGFPHRLINVGEEDAIIIESSTESDNEDSYRIKL